MKKLAIALVALLLVACTKNEVNITPLPNKVDVSWGQFLVNNHTSCFIDPEVIDTELLCKNVTQVFPQITFSGKNLDRNQLQFFHADTLGSEAYELNVTPSKIIIKASSGAGFFYALQTLKQCEQNGEIPCMRVCDSPRFAYRGMHLDVSRHFD